MYLKSAVLLLLIYTRCQIDSTRARIAYSFCFAWPSIETKLGNICFYKFQLILGPIVQGEMASRIQGSVAGQELL